MGPFLKIVDRINEGALTLCGWLTVALVLLTTEQVLARYMFGASSIAMQELEWHLFGVIFLLGAAATFKRDGHVRVDIIFAKLTDRKKALIDIAGTALFLIPMVVVIVIYGWSFAEQARSFGPPSAGVWDWLWRGEASPDPGGLPARWLIKAMIPLGGILLGLQGIARLCRSARQLRPKSPP